MVMRNIVRLSALEFQNAGANDHLQTSLKLTGTPWSGPRTFPVEANSASSAFACARASRKNTRRRRHPHRNISKLLSGEATERIREARTADLR